MAENKDNILLDQVLEKVEYSFTRDILVKPLPEEYIEKEMVLTSMILKQK